jgi:hypothetical protein
MCSERISAGYHIDGAFAEYLCISADRCHRLPDHVGFRQAALGEPLSVAVHAVIERTTVHSGDVAVVSGPGCVGLLTMQIAKMEGARVIIAGLDKDERRLACARQLGADAVVNVERENLLDIVQAHTHGRGADIVYECSGSAASLGACWEVVKKEGTLVPLGIYPGLIQTDFNKVTMKELRVIGSYVRLDLVAPERSVARRWQGQDRGADLARVSAGKVRRGIPRHAGRDGNQSSPETGGIMKGSHRLILLLLASSGLLAQVPVGWKHISSATGEVPLPGVAPEPTASLVVDVDKDGRQDFLIGSRKNGPCVVWYRRGPSGWKRYIVDDSMLRIEAGGAYHDIDGDGDPDIIFPGDAGSNEIWWWENPYPKYDSDVTWTRRLIKSSGGTKHHDQLFGDFDHDGKTELVSWNQGAKHLLLFEVPSDPRRVEEWPSTEIYSWDSGQEHEGLAAADINGDGKIDIVGGGRWFEHTGGGKFRAHVIEDEYRFSRAVAGKFKKGRRAQVVFGPGDNDKRLRFFEWSGDSWRGRDLLPYDVIHGHSLQSGDINGDGHLDIFCGEMGQWGPEAKPSNNPNARLWVFYGNGEGDFTTQVVNTGQGIHEGKLGDFNGDGRLDILGKPFRHNAPRLDIYLNRGRMPVR